MKPIEVFKALSNESRLEILNWLKDPEQHLTPHEGSEVRKGGACVRQVSEKLSMRQGTASQYLSILHRAGLIQTERLGKFTYYKRDEDASNPVLFPLTGT